MGTGRAWQAEIQITLKKGVLDPQGGAVRRSLAALGYEGVAGVRVGKYLEVVVEAPDRDGAAGKIEEMCHRLLANPVIEQYRYQIREVNGA